MQKPAVQKLANECKQYIEAGLIELASEKLIAMYQEAAKLSLDCKKPKKISETAFKHKKKWKKWFDTSCREQKNITRRLAILKHKHPQDLALRATHNQELKKYKKICNDKKNE